MEELLKEVRMENKRQEAKSFACYIERKRATFEAELRALEVRASIKTFIRNQ
jgi:hypothetical protein